MIHVSNLVRKYGDFTAVDGVSFDIPKGQIVGLLGHNGAGKTTIMKMLTGFLEPNAGQVKMAELDIVAQRFQAQQKIGYLPENSPLYPEMTPLAYLEYVAHLRGMTEDQIGSAIQQALIKTQLTDKALQPIATLSKGYQQRVGVAQAILHQPEILILDEPTNGLDPAQILEMRSLIKSLSEHATVLISTHILQEVEAICDRVIIILNGKVARDIHMNEIEKSGHLLVGLDQNANAALPVLKAISGVSKAEYLSQQNGVYFYRVEGGNEKAPEISQEVITKGFKLHQIQIEKPNLETIFREVSSQ